MNDPAIPPQVRQAITLLWTAQLLGVVDIVLTLMDPDLDLAGHTGFFLVISVIVLFALYAALIIFAAKRKNWARITLLVLTIVTTTAFVWMPSEALDPWWTVALSWLISILEIVALFWMFTGAGARWYSGTSAESSLDPSSGAQ